MIKGLYRSASAMLPRIKQQEIIANNLSNASSPGFKKDMVFTRELSRAQSKLTARKSDWQTPMIDQVYTNFEQGGLDKTDNPFDIALEGKGFFVFETTGGGTVLSLAGNLSVNPEGYLVNPEGDRLLGEGGAINVAGGEVTISESGEVQVDNATVANVRVVDVEHNTTLRKVGRSSYWIPEGIEPGAAVDFAIRQGYLESSNVNVIKEMVSMIISYRNYEADAKAVQAQDDSLEKLINNVGRTR
ncbi:MAG: flagellar hook-basal body protein [Candidatus Zixiibacteriota bacterium]|nr:MAG: flagellar hook-basal body protein [candidate division Zixibacteria bacterium]